MGFRIGPSPSHRLRHREIAAIAAPGRKSTSRATVVVVDRESVAKTVRLDMPYLQARIDSDRARNRFNFLMILSSNSPACSCRPTADALTINCATQG
jgi:hypothetical protein